MRHECEDPICQAFDRGYQIGMKDGRMDAVRDVTRFLRKEGDPELAGGYADAAAEIEAQFGGVSSGA